MADTKISALAAVVTPATTDEFAVNQSSTSKKVTFALLLAAIWPIGSVFISVVSTNPSSLIGIGTWSAIGTGRTLVGLNSGDADFNTVEGTGGAKTVASSAQTFAGNASTVIVNHTHTLNFNVGTTDGTFGTFDSSSTTPGTAKTLTTTNPDAGGAASYTPAGTNTPGAATSVVQPYVVVYMWKRTA